MIIKLLALFLLITSAYFSWWSFYAASFTFLPFALITLITAVGLLLSKRWSQYLWHTLALVVSVWWVIPIVRLMMSGWPDGDVPDTIISLVPGLFLITLCAGGSVVGSWDGPSVCDPL